MDMFKRMGMLVDVITKETNEPQRQRLMKIVSDWVRAQDEITSHRDMFFALTAIAIIEMDSYVEDEQAAEGAKILERQLTEGYEPPPAMPPVPKFEILGKWRAYAKHVGIEPDDLDTYDTVRADFYGGAAAMWGLLEGGSDPEALLAEINRFVDHFANHMRKFERKERVKK